MAANDDTTESVVEQAFDYDRTVALSDGVFAIALTLLVLTISFPDLQGAARGHLGTELQHQLGQLVSYALSFAVLGLLWLRHHVFFRELNRIDTRLAALNLVYLSLIAFLPYPTRLIGVYGSQAVSVIVYATTIVLLAVANGLIRSHAVRKGLAPRSSVEGWQWMVFAPAVFLASIPVALIVSPAVAEYCWLLLLLVAVFGRRKPSVG